MRRMHSLQQRWGLSFDFLLINFVLKWSITLNRLPGNRIAQLSFFDNQVLRELLELNLSYFLIFMGALLLIKLKRFLGFTIRNYAWALDILGTFPDPWSISHVLSHCRIWASAWFNLFLVTIVLRNLLAARNVIKIQVQLYIIWV